MEILINLADHSNLFGGVLLSIGCILFAFFDIFNRWFFRLMVLVHLTSATIYAVATLVGPEDQRDYYTGSIFAELFLASAAFFVLFILGKIDKAIKQKKKVE